MATIITIHGTNSTGPEEGNQWWQKGSEFEHDVHEFVEAYDGQPVEFKPFVWDGTNSESARRRAGEKLSGFLQEWEEQQRPFCIVAHSHGGSVVANALLRSATERRRLTTLAGYITVATPFIETVKKASAFSRVGLIGKALYASPLATIALLLVFTGVNGFFDLDSLSSLAFLIACGAVPFGLFFLALLYLERPLSARLNQSTWEFACETYGKKITTLSHRNDEAVCGLGAASSFDRQVIDPRFALTPLLLVSLIVLPILAHFLNIWFRANFALWSIERPMIVNEVVYWVSAIVLDSHVGFGKFMGDLFGIKVGAFSPTSLRGVALGIAYMSYSTALYFFVSLFLLCIIYYPALGLSILLSRFVNKFTWSQVRRSAFGSDLTAEIAMSAKPWPVWLSSAPFGLPRNLELRLQETADKAAAKAIPKLREAIGRLAFSLQGQDKQVAVADLLTWNELIHTVYFKVPIFRKLVCYAIAHSPGFRPREKLKADPDYEKLGEWLAEIQGQTHAAASSAASSSQ